MRFSRLVGDSCDRVTNPRGQGKFASTWSEGWAASFHRPVTTSPVAVASTLIRPAIVRWGQTTRKFGVHCSLPRLKREGFPLLLFARRCFVGMAGGEPNHKYNVVFVLGGPGAGKGTQCLKIEEVIIDSLRWERFRSYTVYLQEIIAYLKETHTMEFVAMNYWICFLLVLKGCHLSVAIVNYFIGWGRFWVVAEYLSFIILGTFQWIWWYSIV